MIGENENPRLTRTKKGFMRTSGDRKEDDMAVLPVIIHKYLCVVDNLRTTTLNPKCNRERTITGYIGQHGTNCTI